MKKKEVKALAPEGEGKNNFNGILLFETKGEDKFRNGKNSIRTKVF
jgi:hypothetical protein